MWQIEEWNRKRIRKNRKSRRRKKETFNYTGCKRFVYNPLLIDLNSTYANVKSPRFEFFSK